VKRVRFVTYGCKANQYDTQVLREALLRRGMSESSSDADLVLINTCTVTAEAGRKAKKLVRRLHREQPDVRIAITGCLAESEPEILRELPGVEWVLGNGEAKRPANFLRELGHEVGPEELGIPAGITEFAGHTRAFLKIQDGCDQACAFCIIPRVRGKSRSRPIDELCAEVLRLVQGGHVEVVLCGIHIGHWGRDLGLTLADLCAALVALDPREPDGTPIPYRLRLSSIEATEVDEPLLALMAENAERLAPHLHMPMQSGSDAVLRAMNRWYDRAEYLEACHRIRAALDRPAFTADVLVGFPGETEQHFQETLDAVSEAGFARVHAFPFSPRPETAAWDLPERVDPSAVRDRRMRLSERASQIGADYRDSLVGATETVVLEGFAGLSGRYQRVRVDPDWIVGVPPRSIQVRLELRQRLQTDELTSEPNTEPVMELWGRPLESPASLGAHG
jgi:threonylcarbamoyladenosine tRNA methylthiotransferase MtaB